MYAKLTLCQAIIEFHLNLTKCSEEGIIFPIIQMKLRFRELPSMPRSHPVKRLNKDPGTVTPELGLEYSREYTI